MSADRLWSLEPKRGKSVLPLGGPAVLKGTHRPLLHTAARCVSSHIAARSLVTLQQGVSLVMIASSEPKDNVYIKCGHLPNSHSRTKRVGDMNEIKDRR